MEIEIRQLEGYSAYEHLKAERELFEELRNNPRPLLLFYICDPVIVVGNANKLSEWVNQEAAQADGIEIIRRFSGGGTVYLNRGVLNYSFIVPRNLIDSIPGSSDESLPMTTRYINFFRRLVIDAFADSDGEFSESGISDINLNGRKISGNAQRISKNQVLHHGTIMLKCPLDEINKYLPIPPNRPGIAHSDFLTSLHGEGINIVIDSVIVRIADQLKTALFKN